MAGSGLDVRASPSDKENNNPSEEYLPSKEYLGNFVEFFKDRTAYRNDKAEYSKLLVDTISDLLERLNTKSGIDHETFLVSLDDYLCQNRFLELARIVKKWWGKSFKQFKWDATAASSNPDSFENNLCMLVAVFLLAKYKPPPDEHSKDRKQKLKSSFTDILDQVAGEIDLESIETGKSSPRSPRGVNVSNLTSRLEKFIHRETVESMARATEGLAGKINAEDSTKHWNVVELPKPPEDLKKDSSQSEHFLDGFANTQVRDVKSIYDALQDTSRKRLYANVFLVVSLALLQSWYDKRVIEAYCGGEKRWFEPDSNKSNAGKSSFKYTEINNPGSMEKSDTMPMRYQFRAELVNDFSDKITGENLFDAILINTMQHPLFPKFSEEHRKTGRMEQVKIDLSSTITTVLDPIFTRLQESLKDPNKKLSDLEREGLQIITFSTPMPSRQGSFSGKEHPAPTSDDVRRALGKPTKQESTEQTSASLLRSASHGSDDVLRSRSESESEGTRPGKLLRYSRYASLGQLRQGPYTLKVVRRRIHSKDRERDSRRASRGRSTSQEKHGRSSDSLSPPASTGVCGQQAIAIGKAPFPNESDTPIAKRNSSPIIPGARKGKGKGKQRSRTDSFTTGATGQSLSYVFRRGKSEVICKIPGGRRRRSASGSPQTIEAFVREETRGDGKSAKIVMIRPGSDKEWIKIPSKTQADGELVVLQPEKAVAFFGLLDDDECKPAQAVLEIWKPTEKADEKLKLHKRIVLADDTDVVLFRDSELRTYELMAGGHFDSLVKSKSAYHIAIRRDGQFHRPLKHMPLRVQPPQPHTYSRSRARSLELSRSELSWSEPNSPTGWPCSSPVRGGCGSRDSTPRGTRTSPSPSPRLCGAR